MWNNKRIKVHDTYGIGDLKIGDIITVEEIGSSSTVKILTINGKPYDESYNNWGSPAFSSTKEWEILTDFEINKWYKFAANGHDNNIAKFKRIENDTYSANDWILNNKWMVGGSYAWINPVFIEELKPEDPRIQDYLPEGHPDKIVEKLAVKDGSYYFVNFQNKDYIFLGAKSDVNHIKIREKDFSKNGWQFWTDKSVKNLREATQEEIQWLDRCIEQNKYISKEEAMKHSIPEYVECLITIKGQYTKGRIYKNNLSKSAKTHYDQDECDNLRPNGLGASNFKPSTEAAYLAQNQKPMKKNIKYLERDAVVHISSKLEWDKIHTHFSQITGYNSEYFYYLVHRAGYARKREQYETGTYIIYEFSDIIFPEIDLIEEAKRRYPIGTKYKCLVLGNNRDNFEITKDDVITISGTGLYIYRNGRVYHKLYEDSSKTWAEIVKEESYKIGDIVIGTGNILGYKQKIGKIVEVNSSFDCPFSIKYYHNNATIWSKIERKATKEEIESISSKESWIPKKGDWAVVTKHFNDRCWPLGKVWQITEVKSYNGNDYECHDKIGALILGSGGFRKALEHEIPTLTPKECIVDLHNTKIWIGDDRTLQKKIGARLRELGSTDRCAQDYEYTHTALYFADLNSITHSGDKKHFDNHRYKEIFPKDLGIDYENQYIASEKMVWERIETKPPIITGFDPYKIEQELLQPMNNNKLNTSVSFDRSVDTQLVSKKSKIIF